MGVTGSCVGIITGVPLWCIPYRFRSIFAASRRKQRKDAARLKRRLHKQALAVAKLKQWAMAHRDFLRLDDDGNLIRQCVWCSRAGPIEMFPWKGDDYHSECKVCFNAGRAGVRAKYPFKDASRKATHRAVRRGELVKTPCEECGEPDVQSHHEEYDRTGLKVRWLCRPCHDDVHRALGPREASFREYKRPRRGSRRSRRG